MNDIDARAHALISAAIGLIDSDKMVLTSGHISIPPECIKGLVDALKGYGIVYIDPMKGDE